MVWEITNGIWIKMQIKSENPWKKIFGEGGGMPKVDYIFRGVCQKCTFVDKGGGGVKNLEKVMTSFMNGPCDKLISNTYTHISFKNLPRILLE